MSIVTLRLPDDVIHKIDINAHTLHITRSEYIKKAILEMNSELQENLRRERLMTASRRVREESMKINAEFTAAENDPEA